VVLPTNARVPDSRENCLHRLLTALGYVARFDSIMARNCIRTSGRVSAARRGLLYIVLGRLEDEQADVEGVARLKSSAELQQRLAVLIGVCERFRDLLGPEQGVANTATCAPRARRNEHDGAAQFPFGPVAVMKLHHCFVHERRPVITVDLTGCTRADRT